MPVQALLLVGCIAQDLDRSCWAPIDQRIEPFSFEQVVGHGCDRHDAIGHTLGVDILKADQVAGQIDVEDGTPAVS